MSPKELFTKTKTAVREKFGHAVGMALLFAFTTHLQAAPITITQTYSSVAYDDYDVTEGVGFNANPTGDWIFKGTVDSGAVDNPPWTDAHAFTLTGLTITQASLGLFDVGIVNAPVLFFYSDRFGFAGTGQGTTPWTVIVYEGNHFQGATTLQDLLALISTPLTVHPYTSFGPQWDGFKLDDGRRLYGWGFGAGSAATSVSTVGVPVINTIALFLIGLCALAYRRTLGSR